MKNLMSNLGGGRVGGNQPPSPPSNTWITAIFGPLNMCMNIHSLPENYLNLLPKYDGQKTHSTEEHIESFQEFTDNMFVEQNNVLVRYFVQNL
jgi:hypothetical protein